MTIHISQTGNNIVEFPMMNKEDVPIKLSSNVIAEKGRRGKEDLIRRLVIADFVSIGTREVSFSMKTKGSQNDGDQART